MTQLDLKNRAAVIFQEAETKVRELIYEAARYVHAEVGKCELDLQSGEKAVVDLATSSITVAGEHVDSLLHLRQILDALHKAPGIAYAVVKDEALNTEIKAVAAVEVPVASADKALVDEEQDLHDDLRP